MNHEQEVDAVQTTVEEEMKSQSSIVAKSCSAALSIIRLSQQSEMLAIRGTEA